MRIRMSSRNQHRAPATHGMMLIEALVYIALLFVVLGLAFMAFYRVFEQNHRLAGNATDIARAVQAGERWRDDIRHATGIPRLTHAGGSSELRIPRDDGMIVYVFRDGSVWRSAAKQTAREEVLPFVRVSQMVADARQHVTAWRWDLELQGRQKIARVPPQFSFLAVPNQQPQP